MKPATQPSGSAMTEANDSQSPLPPKSVWAEMTPTQQQIVFQTLVLICRDLIQSVTQSSPREVSDEPC